jgi:hypothetical protein
MEKSSAFESRFLSYSPVPTIAFEGLFTRLLFEHPQCTWQTGPAIFLITIH